VNAAIANRAAIVRVTHVKGAFTSQARRLALKRIALAGYASGLGGMGLQLSGCSGGGGGEAATTTVPPPPPAAPASVLVTPSSRFAGLTDFPYAENYVTINNMGMHYVDVGPRDAAHTFLCLHGEPSWSYLYRKMIPVFETAGHRVIAPDWFGFGKSHKPFADSTYTFTFHRDSMLEFIRRLDLKRITLVVQDWGGLLGLTLPHVMADRFSRLLIMNTTFANGESIDPTQTDWQALALARRNRWLGISDVDVGQLIQQGSTTATPAIASAYEAPFPDPTYEAGARRFPIIVPITPNEEGAAISREAMAWWGSQWSGQTFMAIGMQDQLLGPRVMNAMRTLIRNCPAPLEIANGGHFVQEDAGAQIAEAALRAFR
jgi:haloalkane dehalogenase